MKKLYLTMMIFLLSISVFSQKGILNGNILNKEKEPLIGVNIINTQNNSGTQTDFDGNFTLNLNNATDCVLEVSYIGYKTQRITVSKNNTDNLTIVLDRSNFALDEIVIVSNRDKESIDEIPSSVSVLTSKDLIALAQNSTTLADVVANVVGVSLSTNTSTSRGQNIRGRDMLIMIDGIPQSTPLFDTDRSLNTIDASVIDRIEVIKGSTSIYGNGAQGGIINYITKKANSFKKFESSTNIGTSGSLVNTDHTIGSNISQLFKGQLGKFSYLVSGSFEETGIRRSAKNEISSPYYGLGETEHYNAFAKFGYQISDNSNIELMYNYFGSNQNTNLIVVDGVYGESPTTGVYGITDDFEEDQGTRYNHNIKLKYEYEDIFNNTNLDVNLYAQEFKTTYSYDSNKYTDVPNGYVGHQNQTTSSKKGARINLNTSYELSDDLNGNLIYGLDLLGDTTEQPFVDGRYRMPEVDMTNIAPYLQIKTKYKDLVFKGGARYETIKVNIDDYTTIYSDNGNGVTSGGVNVTGRVLDYDALTFNFGLRYNKIKYFKPFVSFSQSFSVGEIGRTIRGVSSEDALSGVATEAVIADNYEVGFKSNLTDRIRFEGVYFLTTSDLGVSYQENDVTGEFDLSRSPERTFGYEIQLDTKLTDKLAFGASAAFIEGKTDDNDNGNFDDKEDSYLSGERISPTIFRTYLSYQFSPKWNARLSSTFVGNRDRFEANDNGGYSYGDGPVTSFTTTNLFSSYQLTNNTKLSLGIDNLFNEDYYTVRSQWAGRNNQYEKGNGINFRLGLNINI